MLRFSANVSVLFGERALPERFAAARAAGFIAVEIQNPYAFAPAALASAARAAGVQVVLINAPMGPEGAAGIACRPEYRAQFAGEIARACEYAQALAVPSVNVLAGRAADAEHATCVALLSEQLSVACASLAQVGARALLEPINPLDVPGYCVPSFTLARTILERVAPLGLQFDIYHAARMGLDPLRAFEELLPRIAHVQFADCPGRHEPGTGDLPFASVFAGIRASAYTGWVGAEYRPTQATERTLEWLAASR
jgi:hydroxypyruvate isomerase